MAADSPAETATDSQKPAAQDQKIALPKEKLYGLAWQFVKKVGKELETADLMLSGAGKVTLAEKRSGTQIPEEEPLIMQGILTRYKLQMDQDIYAIKQGKRLMVSLGEFVGGADLAINVTPEKGVAEGWFVLEDQTFFLDANKLEVTIQGTTEKLEPEDIVVSDTDLLVSSALLEKWFGVNINYDFARLALAITSINQLLPAEARYLRGLGKNENDFNTGPPKLPLQEEPYRIFSKPYIDTTLQGGRYKFSDATPVSYFGGWSSIASGDIAKHTANIFASGNKNDPFNLLRVNLSRFDAAGELLGPLNATYYEFGDIAAVPLTLIDQAAQEMGVRFTNQPINISTETVTEFIGNATPDWDVELYRNDNLVDTQRIDVIGQYNFKDVALFAGNNDFKLIFYGPQGEIRQEERRIIVDPRQFEQRKGYFDVSTALLGASTYDANRQRGPDSDTPHIAANYQYNFGNIGTGSIGGRYRSDNGEERVFVQTGLSTYIFDTLFNFNSGYDIQNLEYTSRITARRNIGRNALSLQLTNSSEGYNPNNTGNALIEYSAQANLTGPLARENMFGFSGLKYNTKVDYDQRYDGDTAFSLASRITGRYKRAASVTAGMVYETQSGSSDVLGTSISARGFYKGGQWVAGTGYQILPTPQMNKIFGEYSHKPKEKLSAKYELGYTPGPGTIEGEVSLYWLGDKISVGPRIAANNAGKLETTVNARFGLTPEPFSGAYQMTGKSINGQGGVSARLFLDKNGNGFYEEGEELLPDTVVRAKQAARKATTDEKGIAFIRDIPAGTTTDVYVDKQTFQDITFLSLFDGISVRPRPGIVSKVDFPIVISGEIDGSAYIPISDTSRSVGRNVLVTLTAPDGRIEKAVPTAYDGYYSITDIRPGVYYLHIDSQRSQGENYMLPQKVYFDAEGLALYGRDIALTRGYVVPFTFRGINKPEVPFNRARVEKPDDIAGEEIFIRVGPYHSRLAMTFSWYKLKIRTRDWAPYFEIVTPASKIEPDPKTGKMYLTLRTSHAVDMKEASQICENLIDMKYECGVEVVTHYEYKTPAAPAEAAAATFSQTPKG